MEIIVHQAILHVLDTTLDAPVLSGSCMEMTAEKTAYLQYHIEKLLASDDIRQCRPLPDSAFRYELEQNKDFIDLSCRIAGVLFDYMHAHTTIPGADLAVVDFTRDGQPWLAVLKLNYKNGYTHYTESVDGAPVNSIIQQRACLPTQSGKVDEGALVDLTDYSMKLLERNSTSTATRSSISLPSFSSTPPPSRRRKSSGHSGCRRAGRAGKLSGRAPCRGAGGHAHRQSGRRQRQQGDGGAGAPAAGRGIPAGRRPLRRLCGKSDILEPAQAQQPVTVSPSRIRRMESRSIHTASGIEVKIPTEILSEDSAVEFLHAEDGSVSLLIKNVIL